MNTSLLITVKAFSENVQRFIEPSHYPVAYNLNAGLLNLAKALLQAAQQLLFLAFGKFQIIVRKLGVLLLKLSFDLAPVGFHLKSSHSLDFVARSVR